MRKERVLLNMLKRFFALAVAAVLAVTALPTTSFAAKAVASAVGPIEISGTPNAALPVGSGYSVEVKSIASGTLVLQLSGPGNAPRFTNTTISRPLADTITTVSWNGLRFERANAENQWIAGMKTNFDIISDSGDTTVVSTSNIKLINLNDRNIEKNDAISPTFQIVDYQVADKDVAADIKPYITGYTSNDSFPLANGEVTVKRVVSPESGKFTFDITIPVKYTGKGNQMSFTLAYKTTDGTLRTIDCTTTIPYTREYVESSGDEEKPTVTPDPLTPYIIVENYSYGGSSVTAGTEFQLTLTLRNTSDTHSLQNIVMNVAPQGVFSMTSSSNTLYIDQLFSGSTLTKTVTIQAGLTKVTDDKDANSIVIRFDYQYLINDGTNSTRKTGQSTETITLPVNFPDRFEISQPQISSHNYVGQDCYFYVPMINKGRSSVYNLAVSIRGDGLDNPGQHQYIGNLAAGTESGADFSLRYLTSGEYTGEVVVTYEDANMNPKESLLPFSISVQDMDANMDASMGMNPDAELPPSEDINAAVSTKKNSARPAMIVVGLAVCVISFYTTVQKAKAKRSIFSDEDL